MNLTLARPAAARRGVGKSNYRKKLTVDAETIGIERERASKAIPVARLCADADIVVKTYENGLAGRVKWSRGTRIRLDRATRGLPAPVKAAPPSLIRAVFQAAFVIVAQARGLNVAAVLATDFSQARGRDQEWVKAARARNLAMYLTVVELGLGTRALARAIDCDPATVSIAIRRITEAREDGNETDREICALAEQIAGRP